MALQIGRLSAEAQASLVQYCKVVLDIHKKMSELRKKMEYIDIAYARYSTAVNSNTDGVDVAASAADQPCGVNVADIVVPIVVSQVDTFVGYLSEVYLSGYPLFPVVSSPDTISDSEKLQAIIDDHAIRGRYHRQLGLSFKDAIKYNFSAVEVDWCALDLYNITSDYRTPTDKKVENTAYYINKLNRWNPYNTILDYRVPNPVDIPYCGEYAGHIEICSRVELKRKLAYYEKTGNGYHTSQSLSSKLSSNPATESPTTFEYYTEMPQISNLIQNKTMVNGTMQDWVQYLTNEKSKGPSERVKNLSDIYEHITLYARLIPEEHGMNVPKKGTPQIWKLCFVNHDKLVYAKRIFTIYDTIPVYISQPLEDGFAFQTKSTAEGAIPFQQANSTLFSVRLNSARRAISDRALYDSTAISSDDINSPHPAPKIPFKANALLGGKKLEDIYKQIPFDARGTETVVQDMDRMTAMADKMNGVNAPMQGQFQKGNKSRKEWEDTMAGGTSRMRQCALLMEFQCMLPIKEQIKLNIYQYGVQGNFQNMTTGDSYTVDAATLENLRKTVNNFKLADGFIPAEKIAATDVLVQGMQFLQASPILQATLGPMLPGMFMHMMSQGGVTGLDKYMPKQAATPAQGTPASAPAAPAATTPAAVPQ